MRRTLSHYRCVGTGYLQIETSGILANPWRLPRRAITTIQGKRGLWKELYRTPPNLVEGEEVYEVKTILNHRKRGQGYQYFVKWQGYPISYASWEPEHSFSDDGDTLAQYKLRHHLWQNVISPCLSTPSTTSTGNYVWVWKFCMKSSSGLKI